MTLRKLDLAYRISMDRALVAEGITAPQLLALEHIDRWPGVSSAELARHCDVTAQTMNAIVQNLEAAGLIDRDPHPEHGRIRTIHVTGHGHGVLARSRAIAEDVDREVFAALDQDERATLAALLGRALDGGVCRRLRQRRPDERAAAGAVVTPAG